MAALLDVEVESVAWVEEEDAGALDWLDCAKAVAPRTLLRTRAERPNLLFVFM
jgi:hypothetical protein